MKTPFFISIIVLMLVFSCAKDEGEGGTSTIRGTVMTKYVNNYFTDTLATMPSQEEDVYIIYGNQPNFGDREETNFDGYFEFKYLRPGNYKVFVYTDDLTAGNYSGQKELVYNVEIKDKDQDVDLGEIVKFETLDYNDGSSTIRGKILLVNYYNSSQWPHLEVKDTSNAQDYEVYLIYGDNTHYDDRSRTNYDGTYEFKNLIKGKYTIFVYSEDVVGNTEDIVIYKEVTLNTEGEELVIDDIFVEQL